MTNDKAKDWDHEVDFIPLIGTDRSPDGVSSSMRAVAAELRKHDFMNDFMEEWGEEFDMCCDAEHSDGLLAELYDYCDGRRVLVLPEIDTNGEPVQAIDVPWKECEL